ncbi:DNA-protecting protein DprA [Candidatus Kaiserbacteria bacterium]|nr:DNA-protecting protein DprA [Candidatus Kaiserbacteria bacterium]
MSEYIRDTIHITMESDVIQLNPSEFPSLLSEITDPPQKLYIRGTLPNPSSKLLCVVGSRRHSPYGKDVCETLIQGLSGHDIVIVSGLALGIDAVAHSAALKAGLHTIGVPGSGLDDSVLYPRTNRLLARDILTSGGTLLSEFEPMFKATPYSFPQRNRIMAGMSHATLVIEAGEKSGTLITARLAMEYNRDVLTVPGSIFSGLSYGPHMLIKNGATPITESGDILEAFGIKSTDEHSNLDTHKNLGENEKKVLQFLEHPMLRDELLSALKLPIKDAHILLSSMELKGLIVERLGEIRRM